MNLVATLIWWAGAPAPGAGGGLYTMLPLLLFLPLLYMLLIPVIIPSTLAAYTVVGEREQGTLEPLLTTPIRTMELIDAIYTAAGLPVRQPTPVA